MTFLDKLYRGVKDKFQDFEFQAPLISVSERADIKSNKVGFESRCFTSKY